MKNAGSRWLSCAQTSLLEVSRPAKRARLASNAALPPVVQAKQLLQDLNALLPRLRHPQAALWPKRLAWSLKDLTEYRRGRIAVLGEVRSGASQLVTALLDDPLTSPPEAQEALYARRRTDERPLLLELADEQHEEDITDGLPLPSPFLARSGVDVLECESADADERTECLYRTDHALLVADDVRGTEPVRSLIAQGVAQSGRIVVVENRTAGNSGLAALEVEDMFDGLRGEACSELPWTTGANFAAALEAYRVLRRALKAGQPTPPLFSTLFTASGMTDVMDAVSSLPACQVDHQGDSPAPYQLATAAFVAEACASNAIVAASSIKLELDALGERIAELASTIDEAKRTAQAALKVGDHGMLMPPQMLESAREAIEAVFRKRVRWWQLPFGRVDDVRQELTMIVDNLFMRTLEMKLFHDAGALQSAAVPADVEADLLLASRPFNSSGPYHSSVLENEIAQLEALPVPPDSLARCVTARRRQLTSKGGPLDWIQRRAQLAVLRGYAIVSLFGGSSAFFWTGGALTTSSALAVGVFGLASAAYSLSTSWSRTQHGLLADWKRVEQSLGFDLKDTLQHLLDEVVLAKSLATVAGLTRIVQTRREEADLMARDAREMLLRAKAMSTMKL